jgi:hypothetical protein
MIVYVLATSAYSVLCGMVVVGRDCNFAIF